MSARTLADKEVTYAMSPSFSVKSEGGFAMTNCCCSDSVSSGTGGQKDTVCEHGATRSGVETHTFPVNSQVMKSSLQKRSEIVQVLTAVTFDL